MLFKVAAFCCDPQKMKILIPRSERGNIKSVHYHLLFN